MDASKELAELARLGAAHRVQDLQRLLPSVLGHQVFTLTLGGHAQLPQHKALVVSVTDGAHDRKADEIVADERMFFTASRAVRPVLRRC